MQICVVKAAMRLSQTQLLQLSRHGMESWKREAGPRGEHVHMRTYIACGVFGPYAVCGEIDPSLNKRDPL